MNGGRFVTERCVSWIVSDIYLAFSEAVEVEVGNLVPRGVSPGEFLLRKDMRGRE
jgi:hypothetical protein